MNILLTNDDGYSSIGIKLLQKMLKKYGQVIVVAPKNVMSAKSVSITLGKPVTVIKESENVYSLDGTPADCVAFGLSNFNIDFDIVISGCNDGFNISYDTMYSGTVGACLQALTYEKPAIAISAQGNFEIVEKYFDEVMDYINNHNLLSKEYLLNVNFPLGDVCEKIVESSLYYRKKNTYYIHQGGNDYLAWRIIEDEKCDVVDSDVYCVHHKQISITKLNKTNYLGR